MVNDRYRRYPVRRIPFLFQKPIASTPESSEDSSFGRPPRRRIRTQEGAKNDHADPMIVRSRALGISIPGPLALPVVFCGPGL